MKRMTARQQSNRVAARIHRMPAVWNPRRMEPMTAAWAEPHDAASSDRVATGDGTDAAWHRLIDELDRWQAAGRIATWWWRDDDARTPSAALDRLAETAIRFGARPALAVIPRDAHPDLAAVLDQADLVAYQHGWGHDDHAPAGERKCELGDHRPAEAIAADLEAGDQRLRDLYGSRYVPVLVPPWNRIGETALSLVQTLGYRGISIMDAGPWVDPQGVDPPAGQHGDAPQSAPGRRIDVHLDVIEWQQGARFRGDAEVLDQAVRHLAAKRTGTADPTIPTGMMTHHLDHDPACWRFVEQLLRVTRDHPAAEWADPGQLFARPQVGHQQFGPTAVPGAADPSRP